MLIGGCDLFVESRLPGPGPGCARLCVSVDWGL